MGLCFVFPVLHEFLGVGKWNGFSALGRLFSYQFLPISILTLWLFFFYHPASLGRIILV